MNMLKKIRLALLASGVMLFSYGAYALEKEELEKKSGQPIKPSSETQKTVSSGAKPIGKEKAYLLRQHKFPTVRWKNLPVTQESLKEVSEKSST